MKSCNFLLQSFICGIIYQRNVLQSWLFLIIETFSCMYEIQLKILYNIFVSELFKFTDTIKLFFTFNAFIPIYKIPLQT